MSNIPHLNPDSNKTAGSLPRRWPIGLVGLITIAVIAVFAVLSLQNIWQLTQASHLPSASAGRQTDAISRVAFSPDSNSDINYPQTGNGQRTAQLWTAGIRPLLPTATPSGAATKTAPAQGCLKNGVAAVASDTTYPPFESIDSTTNQIVGFDVDLLNAIGQSQGFTPQFTTENFDTILDKLAQGKYDIVASAVTITTDRAAVVNFSDPYFLSGQAIVVRQTDASKYQTVDDLAGALIGVQKGTSGQDFASSQVTNATVQGYDLVSQAMQALANGDVDVVIIDAPVALNFVATQPNLNLIVTNAELTTEPYGFAVRKACASLLKQVNAGLQAVIADGTYDTIYRQYFGVDAPAQFMPAS